MVNVTIGNLLQEAIQSESKLVFENTAGLTKRDIVDTISNLSLHTGVISGFTTTINADPTRFDITSGTAIVVDRSDPTNPVVTFLDFSGVTAQLDTNLGDVFSHLYVDIDTGVVTTELNGILSLADLYDRVHIGQLIHQGGNIVIVVDNVVVAHGSSTSEIANLVFGGGEKLSLTGSVITANGANLQVNLSAGLLRQFGTGFKGNPGNPNEYEAPDQNSIPVGKFIKVHDASGGPLIRDMSDNLLDPDQYNQDGLGTLVSVSPSSRFTVVRVFRAAGTDDVLFYYGTAQYTTADEALSASEPTFVENIETVQVAPIAKIAIQGDVTDFQSALSTGAAVVMPESHRP